jgi:hypothetical protein
MIKAEKTLALIDQVIEADGGASFRQYLEQVIPKMEDAYRGKSPPFRRHLGASLIGRDCSRELWYSFRWAVQKSIPSRLQRLFNRGHLEEARFIAMLQAAGIEIWYETEDGGQFKFSDVEGHFGSSLDGVVRGVPDLPPDVPAYAEFKTSGDKAFQKVKANGVQNEKFEHYVQMQVCMFEMQLPYSLYMMVNKNDDELHAEIIQADTEVAKRYLDRARGIIYSDEALPKIHDSPGWWKCKFCDARPVCHLDQVPEINCRTCAHATPEHDGSWSCQRGNQEIFTDAMYVGCSEHVFNPYLLSQKVVYNGGSEDGRHTDITLISGDRILQGPDSVTSHQLKERGLS